MKKYLKPEDYKSLTIKQRQNLRSLWHPAKCDLAVAYICKDAENDLFDEVEFVIGDIILANSSGKNGLVFRKMEVIDDSKEEIELEENKDIIVLEDDEEFPEDFDFAYIESEEDYFLMMNCLPILSVGDIIGMIETTKYNKDGFEIIIPQSRKLFGDKIYKVENGYNAEEESKELIDALFEILKRYL